MKRTRWGEAPPPNLVELALRVNVPLAQLQLLAPNTHAKLPQIKQRLDVIELTLAANDCATHDLPNHRRSPSPEPVFDRHGNHVNDRAARRRAALESERNKIIASLRPGNPSQRCWRKLYVPVDEFPTYNFFGAIIGPRGNAQKRMERESGCKIVIRGKGATREG